MTQEEQPCNCKGKGKGGAPPPPPGGKGGASYGPLTIRDPKTNQPILGSAGSDNKDGTPATGKKRAGMKSMVLGAHKSEPEKSSGNTSEKSEKQKTKDMLAKLSANDGGTVYGNRQINNINALSLEVPSNQATQARNQKPPKFLKRVD